MSDTKAKPRAKSASTGAERLPPARREGRPDPAWHHHPAAVCAAIIVWLAVGVAVEWTLHPGGTGAVFLALLRVVFWPIALLHTAVTALIAWGGAMLGMLAVGGAVVMAIEGVASGGRRGRDPRNPNDWRD